MEKAVFYLSFSLFFLGGGGGAHIFLDTNSKKVCDFKACIYLDTHSLLNCDVIYLIKQLVFFFLSFFFQESVELLGPVEIHVRRTESVNGVLPTYIRI